MVRSPVAGPFQAKDMSDQFQLSTHSNDMSLQLSRVEGFSNSAARL